MKGSIQKYVGKTSTSWYAVIDLGPDPVTGRRRQRRMSAPTKRECQVLVAAKLVEADRGQVSDGGKMTLRELCDVWLQASESSLKPSTFRRYKDTVRLHILPVLGAKQIAKLTKADVERLYNDRRKTGLSPTTVFHISGTLHRALDHAERSEWINRNVCELATTPKRATPEMQVWNADEVRAVFQASETDSLDALWRLALLTGMRRGELLGLMWSDVDMNARTLSVRRTLSRGVGGTWELGTPKSAAGRRSIALPILAVDALQRHRARQLERRLLLGPSWDPTDFVFTNETGGSLHVNTLTRKYEKLVSDARVRRIRFHDMRHTSATLLLSLGEHPKIVQERLGHASISMTLDRYSHVTKSMQQGAANAFDGLFGPTK